MHIFLTLHPSGNLAVHNSMTWHRNFYEPLKTLGHDVTYFRLDQFCAQQKVVFRTHSYRQKLKKNLIDAIVKENKRNKIDLIFTYLTNLDIDPETITELRKLQIPIVNFSCNNTHQFHLVKSISPYFTINLHSEKDTGALFQNSGANTYWFQMAANPLYFRPTYEKYSLDCSFVGMNYARRLEFIKEILDNNIDILCFGPAWKYSKLERLKKEVKQHLLYLQFFTGQNSPKKKKATSWTSQYIATKELVKRYPLKFQSPINDVEYVSIINKSKINLGFQEVFGNDNDEDSGIKSHLHLREFEIPMCRALYITNFSDELTEFFVPEKEVVTFKDKYELLDKIRYYLKNEKAADVIREAAYRRSLTNHTYEKRFLDLFSYLRKQIW